MTAGPPDLELLAHWRAGDNRAGSLLVRRHFEGLQRFFSTKAKGHVEDLIQQTFVALVESRDSFRAESTFRTYLFAVARFQLLSHYRSDARYAGLDFTTTSVRDLGTSPTGALAVRQERELLLLALQCVPVDQQIALELTYWEGLAAPEVARVLEISENTVYSRLHRARANLRAALERLSGDATERARVLRLLSPLQQV